MKKIEFYNGAYIYVATLKSGDIQIFDSNKELVTHISSKEQNVRVLKQILENKIKFVSDLMVFLGWFAVPTYEGLDSQKNCGQVLSDGNIADLIKTFNGIYKTNYHKELYEHIREIGSFYLLCDTEFIYNQIKESQEEAE
jgi:hypothetical protein